MTRQHPEFEDEQKFIDQAEPVLGAAQARELVARCWTLEAAPDVARAVFDPPSRHA